MWIHSGQQTLYRAVPVGSVHYPRNDLSVLQVRTTSLRLQSVMNFNVSGRRRSRPDGSYCSGCCGGTGEVTLSSAWAVDVPVVVGQRMSR